MRSAKAPAIKRRRDDGEHELVDHEALLGNGGRVGQVRRQSHAVQEGIVQAADERVARPEGQRVAAHEPQHRDDGHHGEALHHGAQHVLLAHQAAVEQRQAGAGHHQHQQRAGQHPGVVAGRLRGGRGGRGAAVAEACAEALFSATCCSSCAMRSAAAMRSAVTMWGAISARLVVAKHATRRRETKIARRLFTERSCMAGTLTD